MKQNPTLKLKVADITLLKTFRQVEPNFGLQQLQPYDGELSFHSIVELSQPEIQILKRYFTNLRLQLLLNQNLFLFTGKFLTVQICL